MFARGIEENMEKSEFSKLIPGVLRMSEVMSDCKKLANGERFTIDWLPGVGTVTNVKCNRHANVSKEPEFYNAILRAWLGPKATDAALKEALLGQR